MMPEENVESFLEQVRYVLALAKWPAKKMNAEYTHTAIKNLMLQIKNFTYVSNEDQEWWDQQERSNNAG